MENLKSLISQKKPLIAAHRGMAGANIPCNTISAFELALRSGADILEMDLFQTLDGEIFIFHTGLEHVFLDRHVNLLKMTAQEIRQLKLVNGDCRATQLGLNTFDEVLEQFKGRCILNLDRCFPWLDHVISIVERHDMKDQILLKNAPDDVELKKVAELAPGYMFMPIFMERDTKTAMIEGMNINYIGAELVFSTEDAQIAQDSYIQSMHDAGRIVWGNGLVYDYKVPLAAGHNDDVSIMGSPEKGWGWLADKGFDIIQTDWTCQCVSYIRAHKN